MLTGNNQEHVIATLKARKQAHSNSDGRRVALVVEGGGMRGVLSAGALLALDVLGYRQCFDAVLASSAGSVNAAYFLSGQGLLGIGVYFEDLNDRRFFNPVRLNKILDIDYVYDEVVARSKPLDEKTIREGSAEFWVTVTNASTGKNELLDVSKTRDSVANVLKASSALPILYNRTVEVEGIPYVDGGVSSGPPLDWAIQMGFTDILFLSTRPSSFRSKGPSWYERILFSRMIGRRFPNLAKAYTESPARKNRIRRLASGEQKDADTNIATFSPGSDIRSVTRTTTKREDLIDGAHQAANLLCASIGESDGEIGPLFLAMQDVTGHRPSNQDRSDGSGW